MANLEKHNAHCKEIVETLKAYADGLMFSYNGDYYNADDVETIEEDYDTFYVIDGERVNADEVEELSLYDYFDDVYNINYVLDSDRELEAVRVMIACGGPNIYINTWDKRVELFWWSESGEAYLPYELCDQINDLFSEIYNC